MEQKFIDKVNSNVDYKVDKVNNKFMNYAVRSLAAGMFLTLAYTFCMQVVSDFNGTSIEPLGKFFMSYLFGIGLIFIIYFGAELFTSNAMYFSIGLSKRKVNLKHTLKVLVICWIFNFIGAFIAAELLVQTGLFNAYDGHFPNDALYSLAAKKANLPAKEVFFRGILANWVVNIVVFIQAISKEDVARFFIIPLGLMPFVYLGFEHSIANFGIFLMTWLTPGAAESAVYHGDLFTTAGAFHDLLYATLGNIVGGGLLVGGYFAFLTRKKIKKD